MSKQTLFASILYVVGIIYSIIYNLNGHPYLALVPVSIIVVFILPIIFKLMKMKITDKINTLNIIFCFFASIIGSTLSGYQYPYYDKLMHFISGIIFTILGYMLFCIINQKSRLDHQKDIKLMYIFINTFNLSIAILWEFYEYLTLILFQYDCIKHYSTGVHDSITDMMCAFFGGILITLLIRKSYKHNQSNYITKLYEEFYTINQQHFKKE